MQDTAEYWLDKLKENPDNISVAKASADMLKVILAAENTKIDTIKLLITLK